MDTFSGPLIGGVLIGLGSLLAMAGSGKVPGISGIAARLLRRTPGDTEWRALFLLAMIAGAGAALYFGIGWQAYSVPGGRTLAVFAIAGLVVGFGTRMGGGCTSGHGVCGIGSGAKDGLTYTLVFMATAALTVLLWKISTGGATP